MYQMFSLHYFENRYTVFSRICIEETPFEDGCSVGKMPGWNSGLRKQAGIIREIQSEKFRSDIQVSERFSLAAQLRSLPRVEVFRSVL